MTPELTGIQARLDRLVLIFMWAALLIGIALAAVRVESATRVVVASLLAGVYVVAMQALPLRLRLERWAGEALAVGGAAAVLAAAALTDGVDSGFLLLSIAPTLYAAAFFGSRIGIETALLSIAGLVVVAAILDQNVLVATAAIIAGLHLVVATAFSQAHRQYLTAAEESASLRRQSAETGERMRRLETAHDLLLRFSGMTDASELNPVATGQQGLDGLAALLSFDSGLIALNGDDGPVIVARSGGETVPHHRTTFPIESGGREVGFLVLSRGSEFTDGERQVIADTTRPVGLAFSNIILLRDIARRAVREERARLARELHDEIGPSLASLGLALDLAVLQYSTGPELTAHLEGLRGNVAHLVDDIRKTVTDLRADARLTLTQHARSITGAIGPDGPRVSIDIDERRPPRPAIVDDLAAILTEAVRNAVLHSGAETLRIDGFVDHGQGKLTIADDGRGFDPDEVASRRFGLVGMRERAARLGGSIHVESAPGVGTSISVDWGGS